MTAEFAAVAAECSYELPAFPVFSTLHGRLLGDDEPMDAQYWTAHVRATVRFADAAVAAIQADPTHLVEFGAKRTLGPMITRSHPDAPVALNVATDLTGTVASLYRDGLGPTGTCCTHPSSGSAPAQRLFVQHRKPVLDQGKTAQASSRRHCALRDRLTKDSTMDNLIALFREQAAVLAAYGQGGMSAVAPVGSAPQANPAIDTAAIVRCEIARVSGFPEKNLRPTQTISGDLGFDSIMVADVFSGLTRKLPGVLIDPAGFNPATADRRRDRHGGRPATRGRSGGCFGGGPAVAPQFQISEFEEVKALQPPVRLWRGHSASRIPTSWSTTELPVTPRSSTARR